MKKKILFMVSSMNIGGVEKSLLSLLSVIPQKSYEITILMLEKKGGFLTSVPDWVKVEEATWFEKVKPVIMQPPKQTIKGYFQNGEYTKVPFFISAYLLSRHFNRRYPYFKQVFKSVPYNQTMYDVAVSYQGPTETIDYYIAHKVKAKKKIAWVHFDVSKHVVNKSLYTKIYEKYDKVYAVSNEANKRLVEKIPSVENKAEVFQNILSEHLITEMAKSPVDFDSSYKGKKIVTVGRLSTEKGQDFAIKVLSKLRQEGYDVRWYCVGEGKERKEYEALIQQHRLNNDFILLGATPNPYPYIAQADIYVQTSRHEGYCLTLAEAKCLHKPIVTTSFSGASEQLTEGVDGFIVRCDEGELYEKIKLLLDDPVLRQRLTQNLISGDKRGDKQIL